MVIVPVSAVVGKLVASDRSKAGVASAAPSATDTPPNDTELFAKLLFANCVLNVVLPSTVISPCIRTSDAKVETPTNVDIPAIV